MCHIPIRVLGSGFNLDSQPESIIANSPLTLHWGENRYYASACNASIFLRSNPRKIDVMRQVTYEHLLQHYARKTCLERVIVKLSVTVNRIMSMILEVFFPGFDFSKLFGICTVKIYICVFKIDTEIKTGAVFQSDDTVCSFQRFGRN